MRKKILIFSVVSIFSAISTTGCVSEDLAVVASTVAEDWTKESVSNVSEDIGELVTLNIPLLRSIAASIIKNAIRDVLEWEFSTPSEISENRYEVVARAKAQFSIPLVGTYAVSVDYHLEIDVKNETVIDASIDLGSFSFE